MRTRWAALVCFLCIALSLAIVPLAAWKWWPQPRGVLYRLYRDQGKAQTLSGLQSYELKSGKHFDIYFTETDRDVVDMVLATAEQDYGLVTAQIGYAPTGRVPVIVYHTRGDMQQAFGWSSKESAMGVYWKGTIRLLSPHAWVDEQDAKTRRQVFAKLNPIAHEFTHYVLDMYTNGNYPRWFTEGLAQYVEHDITGYLWLEQDSTLRRPLYTLDDLIRRYDTLANQPLAYRESYLMIDYLVKTYGRGHLSELVQQLGSGVSFNAAVDQTYGAPADRLFADCLQWIHDNINRLDPVQSAHM